MSEFAKPTTPNYGSKYTSGKITKVNERNYKCPNCKGEFNKWENQYKNHERSQCPFCGLEKKSYKDNTRGTGD